MGKLCDRGSFAPCQYGGSLYLRWVTFLCALTVWNVRIVECMGPTDKSWCCLCAKTFSETVLVVFSLLTLYSASLQDHLFFRHFQANLMFPITTTNHPMPLNTFPGPQDQHSVRQDGQGDRHEATEVQLLARDQLARAGGGRTAADPATSSLPATGRHDAPANPARGDENHLQRALPEGAPAAQQNDERKHLQIARLLRRAAFGERKVTAAGQAGRFERFYHTKGGRRGCRLRKQKGLDSIFLCYRIMYRHFCILRNWDDTKQEDLPVLGGRGQGTQHRQMSLSWGEARWRWLCVQNVCIVFKTS